MRLCVVDDHEVVREGLRLVLDAEPGMEVVAEAACGSEALNVVRRTLPDVVLCDFRLPDMTGTEVCRQILELAPSTSVVMLTTYLSEDVVQRSADAGAAAFVTKAAGLGELRSVLAQLDAGGPGTRLIGATSAVVQRLYTATKPAQVARSLTPQQERVLELAAAGLTYGQISRELHVSESTVRFHMQRLKERLGVRTKAELIALAVRSALISPGRDAVSA